MIMQPSFTPYCMLKIVSFNWIGINPEDLPERDFLLSRKYSCINMPRMNVYLTPNVQCVPIFADTILCLQSGQFHVHGNHVDVDLTLQFILDVDLLPNESSDTIPSYITELITVLKQSIGVSRIDFKPPDWFTDFSAVIKEKVKTDLQKGTN